MKFSTLKDYIKRGLPIFRFVAFITPNKLDDAAVFALEAVVAASDAGQVDWALVRTIIDAAVPVIDELMKLSFIPERVKDMWALVKTFLLGAGNAPPVFDAE